MILSVTNPPRHDRDIEAEDFLKYTDKVQASLQDCPMEKAPAALHQKPSKNSSKLKQGMSRKVNARGTVNSIYCLVCPSVWKYYSSGT